MIPPTRANERASASARARALYNYIGGREIFRRESSPLSRAFPAWDGTTVKMRNTPLAPTSRSRRFLPRFPSPRGNGTIVVPREETRNARLDSIRSSADRLGDSSREFLSRERDSFSIFLVRRVQFRGYGTLLLFLRNVVEGITMARATRAPSLFAVIIQTPRTGSDELPKLCVCYL